MRQAVHIPPAERQTETRIGMGFWIDSVIHPKLLPAGSSRSRFGTWLIRSQVNPYWHAIETPIPVGQDPRTQIFYQTKCIMGGPPRFVDDIIVLQPDEVPNMRHTTFLYGMRGEVPSGAISRQHRLPGITDIGFFGLDNLPNADMDPRLQDWIGPILQSVVEQGTSPQPLVYHGPPYGERQ